VRRSPKAYWSLLREFTVCGFKLRDQGTVLGFLWTLLHPLLLLAVLYLLFRNRLGTEIPHFRIYLLVGIIHWSFFSTATTKAIQSVALRRDLVTNVHFPREILVIGDVGTVLISFVLEIGVLFGFILVEGIPVRAAWLLLPVIAGLQGLLIVGVALFLAAAQVFVQDIERIWTLVLRIGFFLVPIFYDPRVIENDLHRQIFLLNPLTQIMTFSRTVLIEGRIPDASWMIYTLAIGLLLTALSLRFFRRLEPSFAERL
jgi:ABC-2 type transport system permease protein